MAGGLRVLFVYRFCTKGGVESMLRNRLETIERHFSHAVHADIVFFSDFGGRSLFTGDVSRHVFFITKPQDVRNFILKNGYDYVISIDTPEIFPMIKGINVRKILEVHTHYDTNRSYLRSVLDEEPGICAITVPSDYFKKKIERETDNRVPVRTVYNFIGKDYRGISDGPERAVSPPCPKAIGWAGRLDNLKNWEEFLDIGHHVLAHRKDVELVIIGDTPEEREKKKFYRRLSDMGVLPHVRWLPFHTGMASFYRYLAATGGCFVSTSRGESFGMTVLESMACGCPVLCANIGAFSELLNAGEYGLLYDPGDVDGASAKVEHILDDNEYRERVTGRACGHAVKDYDGVEIMARWIGLLNEYLAGRP
jgi:glycosyltransferase involved in cell wall biosynthesis